MALLCFLYIGEGRKILPCNGPSTTTTNKLCFIRSCYKLSFASNKPDSFSSSIYTSTPKDDLICVFGLYNQRTLHLEGFIAQH